jgi:hypothetical protein
MTRSLQRAKLWTIHSVFSDLFYSFIPLICHFWWINNLNLHLSWCWWLYVAFPGLYVLQILHSKRRSSSLSSSSKFGVTAARNRDIYLISLGYFISGHNLTSYIHDCLSPLANFSASAFALRIFFFSWIFFNLKILRWRFFTIFHPSL